MKKTIIGGLVAGGLMAGAAHRDEPRRLGPVRRPIDQRSLPGLQEVPELSAVRGAPITIPAPSRVAAGCRGPREREGKCK
jgi:hypothetical protein